MLFLILALGACSSSSRSATTTTRRPPNISNDEAVRRCDAYQNAHGYATDSVGYEPAGPDVVCVISYGVDRHCHQTSPRAGQIYVKVAKDGTGRTVMTVPFPCGERPKPANDSGTLPCAPEMQGCGSNYGAMTTTTTCLTIADNTNSTVIKECGRDGGGSLHRGTTAPAP